MRSLLPTFLELSTVANEKQVISLTTGRCIKEKRLKDSYSEVLYSEFGTVDIKPSALPPTVGKSLLWLYFCNWKRNLQYHFVKSFKHKCHIRVRFYIVGAKPDCFLVASFWNHWVHVRCYTFQETAKIRDLGPLWLCLQHLLTTDHGCQHYCRIPCLYFYLNGDYSFRQASSSPSFLLGEETRHPYGHIFLLVEENTDVARTSWEEQSVRPWLPEDKRKLLHMFQWSGTLISKAALKSPWLKYPNCWFKGMASQQYWVSG